jgi:glutaminyl-tRNA synthetase
MADAFDDELNEESLRIVPAEKLEPGMQGAAPGQRFQFERLGYFAVDPNSVPGQPVFNRVVTLRDTWAKLEQTAAAGAVAGN